MLVVDINALVHNLMFMTATMTNMTLKGKVINCGNGFRK